MVEEASRSLETLETTKESVTHESPEGTTTTTSEHVRLDQLKQVTLSVVAKDCMLGGMSETVSIPLFLATFT